MRFIWASLQVAAMRLVIKRVRSTVRQLVWRSPPCRLHPTDDNFAALTDTLREAVTLFTHGAPVEPKGRVAFDTRDMWSDLAVAADAADAHETAMLVAFFASRVFALRRPCPHHCLRLPVCAREKGQHSSRGRGYRPQASSCPDIKPPHRRDSFRDTESG